MRHLYLSVLGVSVLAFLGGCQTTCNRSWNDGCHGGGNSGCGAGGGIGCLGGHDHSHTHGVCDCDIDEYCSSRTPWIRFTPPPMLGAPVEPAPVAPKVLPKPGLDE